MKALEVMRVHVNTIMPDALLPDVIDRMDLYQLVLLTVVDDEGRPLGVVTESDIEEALLLPCISSNDEVPGHSSLSDNTALTEGIYRARQQSVASMMSSPAVCVDEHTDVLVAAQMMTEHGFSRLPVTSGGILVGTLSRIDIYQGLLETTDRIADDRP